MQDRKDKVQELPDDDENNIEIVKKKQPKNEVQFNQLNDDERRQFVKSKEKEWGSLRDSTRP